jgi:Co/Zn/Cd efflux system component
MALKIILVISMISFVSQVVGGFIFGSLSVLSDGFHSLFDNVGNIFRFVVLSIPMVVLSLSYRQEHNREKETFKREFRGKLLEKLKQIDLEKSTFHAMRFNALMLPVTGSLICIAGGYRAWDKHSIHAGISMWFAGVGLVCNLLQIVVLFVLDAEKDMKDVFFHLLGDAMGSVFALSAMWINSYKGDDHWWVDPILTIGLGVWMCYVGITLLEKTTPKETKAQFPDHRVLAIGRFTILISPKHSHDSCDHSGPYTHTWAYDHSEPCSDTSDCGHSGPSDSDYNKPQEDASDSNDNKTHSNTLDSDHGKCHTDVSTCG